MSFFGVTNDGSLRYTESQSKEIKLTPFKWSRNCSLSDSYFVRFKDSYGVSRLNHMALRSVVKYRHGLTEDVLQQIPWDPLGRQIWNEVVKM